MVDACSHADLTQTDTEIYPTWALWPRGSRGDFSDLGTYTAHVARVFEIQHELETPFLLPVPRLDRPDDALASTVLEMITRGREIAHDVAGQGDAGIEYWVTLAGTSNFWSAGRDLDVFIDSATSVSVDGWYVVPVQGSLEWPVDIGEAELAGLLRTVHSLSTWGTPVLAAHADLLGIPLVAAGASFVGSGWDRKQRCFHPQSHAPVDADGGSWLQTVTLGGIVAGVGEAQAVGLFQQDRALGERVLPGSAVPAGGRQRVQHHLEVLRDALQEVAQHPSGPRAVEHVLNVYGRSYRLAPRVEEASGATRLIEGWVRPAESGLERWAADEGWPV